MCTVRPYHPRRTPVCGQHFLSIVRPSIVRPVSNKTLRLSLKYFSLWKMISILCFILMFNFYCWTMTGPRRGCRPSVEDRSPKDVFPRSKNVQRWQALHSTHPPAALSSVTKQAPAIATCFLLFLLLLLPIILLLLLLLPLLLLLLYLGGT